MKRRTCLGLLGSALIVPFVTSIPNSIAQSSGDQATVSALQTQVSLLQTKAALQTKVAALETQVAQGGTGTPSAAGKPLYQADWSTGAGNWQLTPDWQAVGGMLVNNGATTDRAAWLAAPYQPETANYAVEAQIQFVRTSATSGGDCLDTAFGVVGRGTSQGGYFAGMLELTSECNGPANAAAIWPTLALSNGNFSQHGIGDQPFDPDTDWHTYRLELQGNGVRLLIDDRAMVVTTDNRFLSRGKVGLFARLAQVSVRGFTVTAL